MSLVVVQSGSHGSCTEGGIWRVDVSEFMNSPAGLVMTAGIFGVLIAAVFAIPIARAIHRRAAAAEDANDIARSTKAAAAAALREERGDISQEIGTEARRLYAAIKEEMDGAAAQLGRDIHTLG